MAKCDNNSVSVAPTFSKEAVVDYTWWGWSPSYPFWSESCWHGDTIAEAVAKLEQPHACKMMCYDRVLVKRTTTYEVVQGPIMRGGHEY